MKILSSVWCVFLVIELTASCQSPLRPVSALLSDERCQPPCWRGIILGQTTEPEVLMALQGFNDVKTQSITENRVDDHRTNIWAEFNENITETGVRIYFFEHIAVAISFDTRGSLTLASVMEKTGEPESVYATSGCADTRWLLVGLLNRKTGFFIDHFNPVLQRNGKAEISPNSRVSRVTYFDPMEYERVLNAYLFLGPFDNLATFAGNLQPWVGYGEVTYIDVCK